MGSCGLSELYGPDSKDTPKPLSAGTRCTPISLGRPAPFSTHHTSGGLPAPGNPASNPSVVCNGRIASVFPRLMILSACSIGPGPSTADHRETACNGGSSFVNTNSWPLPGAARSFSLTNFQCNCTERPPTIADEINRVENPASFPARANWASSPLLCTDCSVIPDGVASTRADVSAVESEPDASHSATGNTQTKMHVTHDLFHVRPPMLLAPDRCNVLRVVISV